MSVRVFFAAIVALLVSAAANAQRTKPVDEPKEVACASPPSGVIRFTLTGGADEASQYVWTGSSFRRVGFVPVGKDLISRFKPGSFYQWNYWGSDVADISRSAAGSNTMLGTPYAGSGDGNWFVAGALTTGARDVAPMRLVLLRRDSQAVVRILERNDSVAAVAWSPDSDALVVLSRAERYGKKTLRQWFAAAIGHPIPFAKITLSVFGRDGSLRCSIVPSENLPYGDGYVRWDAN